MSTVVEQTRARAYTRMHTRVHTPHTDKHARTHAHKHAHILHKRAPVHVNAHKCVHSHIVIHSVCPNCGVYTSHETRVPMYTCTTNTYKHACAHIDAAHVQHSKLLASFSSQNVTSGRGRVLMSKLITRITFVFVTDALLVVGKPILVSPGCNFGIVTSRTRPLIETSVMRTFIKLI